VRRRGRSILEGQTSGRRAWTGRPYESGVWLADPSDDEVRAAVTHQVRALRTPDGAPVVQDVRHGVGADAPDLSCVLASPSVELHDGMHASGVWVPRDRVAWGTHDPRGVIAIAGVDGAGPLDGDAVDVAPTLLSLLGLHEDGLDGRPLVGGATMRGATSTRAEVGARFETPAPSAADEEAMLAHLRGLGYVD
jgi:hypothetical protein